MSLHLIVFITFIVIATVKYISKEQDGEMTLTSIFVNTIKKLKCLQTRLTTIFSKKYLCISDNVISFQCFKIFLPEGFPDDTTSELTKVLSNNTDVEAIKINQFTRDDGIFILFLASLSFLI